VTLPATFSTFLRREHVFTDVPAGERDDVLRAVLDRLVEAGAIDEETSTTVLRAVLKRERTGTTGIGRGIAIPHCKTAAVATSLVAFARTTEPIAYGAADGDPVNSLFLIVSPPDSAESHVEILKSVAKMARDDYATRVLRNTNQRDSLYEFFCEMDAAP
jgi:mannitol/fructose-specific phosphotransferase system IIA component (Ntr-type)